MSISLKYAVVERERRFLVTRVPDGVVETKQIVDRYLMGTRMRLREVHGEDGTVTRKLGHKVRLGEGPAEVACTNFYVDDQEWATLSTLPARTLRKTRHLVQRDGLVVAVDEHEDGTLVAEIDDGDTPSTHVPEWLEVLADVTADERWTGIGLAQPDAATVAVHRDGTPERGAYFVNEFGMGPAERTLSRPTFEDMGLDAVEAANALADVVALSELLLEELATATDVPERAILTRIEEGVDPTSGT